MFLLNSTRAVVQECVERNLVQCKNDFGAIMTEVLKPFANMFVTIGDTFCKRGKKINTLLVKVVYGTTCLIPL